MGMNRKTMRFDKRLISRNLREGTISLEELNEHLARLEDVSHLAAESRPFGDEGSDAGPGADRESDSDDSDD